MKPLLAVGLAALIVSATTGCEKSTVNGPAGKRLTLYKPADQTLVRGETNQIAIVVARENFGGNIKIRFENLPKGVTVIEGTPLPSDLDRAVYTLHARPDADLVSNNEVRVVAEGPDGLAIAERFLLTVRDRAGAKPKPETPF